MFWSYSGESISSMANFKTRVASFILKEQFGEIVEKVGIYLIRKGGKTIRDITEETKVERNEVKKSLCVLIKHELALYEQGSGLQAIYRVIEENVILRLRHPRFIYIVKLKCGDIGELIIEELLGNGCGIISRIANKVIHKQIQDEKGNQVNPSLSATIQKFLEMIQSHIIKRTKPPPTSSDDKSQQETGDDDYAVPPHILPELGRKKKERGKSDEPPEKRLKSDDSVQVENEVYVDEDVYWYVNFQKLHQLILEDLIVSAIGEKIDQAAGKIAETMLTKSGEERDVLIRATKSLASFEILRKMPTIPRLSQDEVSQYLSLLADEKTGGFLQKTDETGGGMYCVNLYKCVELLCQSTLESVVQERFGSKALRIFRLLLMKKYLEQKQIGEMAMIPFKESKELLYKLLQENFVRLQEISKAGDYAPSRAFYLFGVDLPHVSRLVLGKSYQALGNMMARRDHEIKENKRLLEKNEKIEAVLATIGGSEENAEVTQELEELITPAEKDQLEKLKIDLTRIEHGEVQVDETLFVLQQYLSFH